MKRRFGIALMAALALNPILSTAQPQKVSYTSQDTLEVQQLAPKEERLITFTQNGRPQHNPDRTMVAGLSVYANDPVVVFVNGTQMSLPAQSSFIANLCPGNYVVQVYAADALNYGRPDYSSDPVWQEKIWCKPDYTYRINFTRRGLHIRPDTGYFPYQCGRLDNSYPGTDHPDCFPGQYPDLYPGHHHGHNPHGQYLVMPPKVFDRFLHELGETRWDDEREEMISIAKKNALFTVEQCRRMMEICRFESDKLEIAKLVYPALYDKQNVFLLFDCFRFRSDKNEFADFIRDYED